MRINANMYMHIHMWGGWSGLGIACGRGGHERIVRHRTMRITTLAQLMVLDVLFDVTEFHVVHVVVHRSNIPELELKHGKGSYRWCACATRHALVCRSKRKNSITAADNYIRYIDA